MSPRDLLEPILDGGIRNIHFFEGRLLTGRDLREQLEANRTYDRHLGCAIGAGVAKGLEVDVISKGADGKNAVVAVRPGLAITEEGQVMHLRDRVEIALVPAPEAPKAVDAAFTICQQPPSTALVPAGTGVYVLLMSPVSVFRERAPKSGLGDEGKIAGCGSRYTHEGFQFRLQEIDPAGLSGISEDTRTLLNELMGATDPAGVSKLRNVLAHLCFGTEALPAFALDPFARSSGKSPLLRYGALDNLRETEHLTTCDVPLALFYWTVNGIQFHDLWSVRRRPVTVTPSAKWPALAGQRRLAEAEAMLFQFQEHIEWLVRDPDVNPASIRARDYFRYLPPAGFLPIQSRARPRGFTVPNFFSGKTRREVVVYTEGARLESLFAHSLEFPAVKVSDPEMLWLYLVRENWQSDPGATSAPAPYVIFSSGYMDYYGHARFDVAHWDYSNYALVEAQEFPKGA